MQDRPGVGPRWPLLVVHVGGDREADEQRDLVRVVVDQLDADRQPLDDLHEVARGILRRQQGEGLPGPHGEAGDAALELMPAAVHVDLTAHPMADAQVRQLGLLEVGVDPDLGERADGHQALPGGDIVAGVDVAAGHHAVDLADDVAVAEVELGQREVAAGLVELGLGLLDGGCLGNQVGKDAIEIAFRVLLQEDVEGLLRGQDPRRGSVPEQGGAAVTLSQRLPDRRVILVEVVGDLAQVVARGRLGGEAQTDSRRQDGLAGLDRQPTHRP